MIKRFFLKILMAGLIFQTSCSLFPEDIELNQEQLVDITKYDLNTDFTTFRTFSVADSICLIMNGDSSRVLNEESQQVINRIIHNMQERGYTLVNKSDNPDLGINVSLAEVYGSYFYPGWYWDYGAYYDPDYWGFPACEYFYPYDPPEISVYTAGTLMIDLLDLKNAPSYDQKIHMIWNAYIRGLINGTHTLQQVLDNIDQCYLQTPVLRAN